ncbi:hypothetical protein GY45DRAFT_486698 [Cubamyces sp. BRFM 1775]|nr:hypothetical protein GY45DRAFT_486698 [Cubamyces sp. BRFM 1775]
MWSGWRRSSTLGSTVTERILRADCVLNKELDVLRHHGLMFLLRLPYSEAGTSSMHFHVSGWEKGGREAQLTIRIAKASDRLNPILVACINISGGVEWCRGHNQDGYSAVCYRLAGAI